MVFRRVEHSGPISPTSDTYTVVMQAMVQVVDVRECGRRRDLPQTLTSVVDAYDVLHTLSGANQA